MNTLDNNNNNNQAMQTLRDLGIATVVVHFSGGNDEGGADDTEAFDAAGEPVALKTGVAYETSKWDSLTKTYKTTGWLVWSSSTAGGRPATEEEIRLAELHKVLEAPIYERWGSFAGDFSVQGTITWDTSTGEHVMSGQESVTTWESF